MSGIVRTGWLALGLLACSAPDGAGNAPLPAEPLAATSTTEPALDELRGLLEEARSAQASQDYDLARSRISGAIERALSGLGGRTDDEACLLLEDLAAVAQTAGELPPAERARRRILEARESTLPADHADVQRARSNFAATSEALGDLETARALQEKVLEVRLRTLPDDHPDLQTARCNLAVTLQKLGDLHGARAFFEKVLEIQSRELPDEHPDLQRTRQGLAITIRTLGDLQGARALEEKILEIRSRTLPDDHPDLQVARSNLAATISGLGDLQGARELQEKVLELYSRTLPDDHPNLQAARGALASTIGRLGDLQGSRALKEKVLEVLSRTLPEDHLDLQVARMNLSGTLGELGDLHRSRALCEQVLEAFSRTLPDDHPYLQGARGNLALTIKFLGDIRGARTLEEKMLEVFSRTLPDDHPDLQKARGNFAGTIFMLGDLQGARALFEKVLEVYSRTLPDEHPDLQFAREELARTIRELGNLQGARALQEKVLEVRSRTLPDEHPDLQEVRGELALTIQDLGDLQGARALLEKVLEVDLRTLPDEHPELQEHRLNLASTISMIGDFQGASALEEKVLEVYSRTLPDGHPFLQAARQNHAWTLARLDLLEGVSGVHPERSGARPDDENEGRERCKAIALSLCQAQTNAAREALLMNSPREAQALCESLGPSLDVSLSIAEGGGVFDPIPSLDRASFVLSETTRGAALGAAALMWRAANAPEYSNLRSRLRAASDELAALAQNGTTSESFQAALARRDEIQRDLGRLARQVAGGAPAGLDFDVDTLAKRLSTKDAVVGFRRYKRTRLEAVEGLDAGSASVASSSVESLCAFVLRGSPNGTSSGEPSNRLMRIELGPIAPIEAAVKAWREAIDTGLERGVGVNAALADTVRTRGVELRTVVLDPLLSALGNADRIVLALDDVLHLVPIEALPMDEQVSVAGGGRGVAGGVLVGDRWRIETRCTLAEVLAPDPAPSGGNTLVALGGASFNSDPLAPSAEDLAEVDDARESAEREPEEVSSILRGGAWERGFTPLTYTGLEAREIAAIHDEVFEKSGSSVVLEKRKASREALEGLAPRAHWLHVATHGWFASESIRSWKDSEPLDKLSGLGMRPSGDEQVKGMSPMLLCGLALAGANLPENELGRAPGLVTAEEIAALDLTRCELAVLSACDTNVGERRAGQGVASLQMALQMAGARSVITSLWKVPDEATRELMTDFYRRIWVEKKPKQQALWEAKMKLRAAKDESGRPKYALRDWAAWVLTGEPL